jgi:hypothetical protein
MSNNKYIIVCPALNRVDEFLFDSQEDARQTAEQLGRAPFKIVEVEL